MTSTEPATGLRQLPVLVERWRRYGHDRAYVKIMGTQIGYRDLRTGDVHCDQPEHRTTIADATDHLLPVPAHSEPAPESAAEPGRRPAEPANPVPVPVTTTILLPDRDLAGTAPGSAARSQAVALREAAPVRTFLARVFGAHTDERAWRIGADGETEVGRQLSRLAPEWRCVHAVPVGERGSDIDHLVIGPGGVFTINTKNRPDSNVWVAGDRMLVNGRYYSYVRNSRHEAQRAASLLSARLGLPVGVRGIVAVQGAERGFTVKAQPEDGTVFVTRGRDLPGHLGSWPRLLDPAMVDRIHDAARHLATWQPGTVAWTDF